MTMQQQQQQQQQTTATPRDHARAERAEREAALGLAIPDAEMVRRARAAFLAAFHNLDMAERRGQPPFVLDKFERDYFAALARFAAIAPVGTGG